MHLKERRHLVLVARESPLHLGHLRAMVQVTECGAIVAPPTPAFYHRPRDIGDIIDQLARRTIDLLALTDVAQARPWPGIGSSLPE